MGARAIKKPAAFRLDENLIDKLKAGAKKANRSLNNYVECILMDSVYNDPNAETLESIAEARAGKHAGKLEMSNFDAFMKSVNDIE